MTAVSLPPLQPKLGFWRAAYCAHYRMIDAGVERHAVYCQHRPTWALFMSDRAWAARPEYRPPWWVRRLLEPGEWHPWKDTSP